MFRVRRWAGVGLIAALLLSSSSGQAEPPAGKESAGGKEQPTSFWMKKKLDYSQNILRGVALADFDAVAENAQAMKALSKIEGFVRRGTRGYSAQLQNFEQALDDILEQANKDNVEGVALAFTQLTVSCVNCHKQLREGK